MKAPTAYKTISEAAKALDVTASTIRFWETEFKQIKPYSIKGRRYYSIENVEILQTIKDLLYNKGYTIAGAAKYLAKPQGENNSVAKMAEIINKLKLAREELA